MVGRAQCCVYAFAAGLEALPGAVSATLPVDESEILLATADLSFARDEFRFVNTRYRAGENPYYEL